MSELERLTVLIEECAAIHESGFDPDKRVSAEALARYLLANGVILPPVRVGDTVYYIVGGHYKSPDNCKVSEPCKVVETSYKIGAKYRQLAGFITNKGTRYSFDGIGKTVFFTREEAEAELKKRRKERKQE